MGTPFTGLLLAGLAYALLVAVVTGQANASEPAGAATDAEAAHGYLVRLDVARLLDSGIDVVRYVGFGWTLVEIDANNEDVDTLLAELGVVWEANTIYELVDDPLFNDQWALENTGQSDGTVDADIDAPDAWSMSTSDPGQIIAIIDSGVDLDHPDLDDRIWVNTGEIPGNGTDDDINGYIDDVNGWDTVDGDADPNDELGHGTAVAGTAAASSNGVGVVGVAPDATIMPIRVCNPGCPVAAIVEGIKYAIDNGATIINLSLGLQTTFLDPALEDAVAAANDAGVLVVAAAGNNDMNNDISPFYPANIDLPNVISVAATDRNDALATFSSGASNYGATTVDLAAPGKDIVTSVIGGWAEVSGTSFAAPMVAGTAALILSLRPTATPAQIIDALLGTVDELPGLTTKTLSGGRLNAHSAVLSTEPPTATAAGTPTLGWRSLTVSMSAAGSSDPGGGPLTWEWTSGAASASGYETDIVLSEIGVLDVTLTVTDVFGSTASDSVTVLVGEDFVDTRTSIFRLDIAWMSSLGITRGCNPPTNDLYCPGGHVTRAQTAAFLARALNLPATGTDYFTDDTDSIFEADINRLAAAGITLGCNPPTNDEYCPANSVTREQMAAFLTRALNLPATGTDYFTDDTGSIFESDINRLAAASITKGCNPPRNDRFCPGDVVTREQMAGFLHRSGSEASVDLVW
jgi:subtilisin family serine protease